MHNRPMRRKNLVLAVASVSLASFVYALPAKALELDFDHPSISGRLDTSVSLVALWRTESRAADLAPNDADIFAMAHIGCGTQFDPDHATKNFDRGLASF